MILNLPDLPEGWHFTHIVDLAGCWQVNACNGEHVVVATGVDLPDAFAQVADKILREDFCGILFRLVPNLVDRPKIDPRNLLQSLGLAKPINIPRRMGL